MRRTNFFSRSAFSSGLKARISGGVFSSAAMLWQGRVDISNSYSYTADFSFHTHRAFLLTWPSCWSSSSLRISASLRSEEGDSLRSRADMVDLDYRVLMEYDTGERGKQDRQERMGQGTKEKERKERCGGLLYSSYSCVFMVGGSSSKIHGGPRGRMALTPCNAHHL